MAILLCLDTQYAMVHLKMRNISDIPKEIN